MGMLFQAEWSGNISLRSWYLSRDRKRKSRVCSFLGEALSRQRNQEGKGPVVKRAWNIWVATQQPRVWTPVNKRDRRMRPEKNCGTRSQRAFLAQVRPLYFIPSWWEINGESWAGFSTSLIFLLHVTLEAAVGNGKFASVLLHMRCYI